MKVTEMQRMMSLTTLDDLLVTCYNLGLSMNYFSLGALVLNFFNLVVILYSLCN